MAMDRVEVNSELVCSQLYVQRTINATSRRVRWWACGNVSQCWHANEMRCWMWSVESEEPVAECL